MFLFEDIHLGSSNISKMMFNGLSLFICKKCINNSIVSKDCEKESYILSQNVKLIKFKSLKIRQFRVKMTNPLLAPNQQKTLGIYI